MPQPTIPTPTDPPPDHGGATLHIERYGREHRAWLAYRYTARPQSDWLLVRRQGGRISVCFPGYTAASYGELVEQARRVADTWQATFMPLRPLFADLASPITDKAHDIAFDAAADAHNAHAEASER